MALKLTIYGLREVVIATVLAAGACVVFVWLFWPGAFAVVPLWALVLCFFRDPPRHVPAGEGLFVSPADGRVADITTVGPDSALGCDGVQVGIFMSIFDVHVNHSPADGRVERIEHRCGRFLDARDRRASTQNESTTIRMNHAHGGKDYPIVVRQIAGLVARRIVTDIKEGQRLSRGERIGMIKFGSRLELLVPRELVGELCVSQGRRVRAGESVLITAARNRGNEAEIAK